MEASAVAHPNIALIKYWGKREASANLPAVGSLSITLDAMRSLTRVVFDAGLDRDRVLLNGQEDPGTTSRVSTCLDLLRRRAVIRCGALVTSENDFPTGAGLASSASGFAALVTAAAAALDLKMTASELGDIARIGSGSAPRSLYGGFALLQNRPDGSVSCEQWLAETEWPLAVIIAVTTPEPKEVSSRDGMEQSRLTSPYYAEWVATHAANLLAGMDQVRGRDFSGLADLAEHNCLKMHAVMMTTRPPLIYWTPATLACMQTVQALRRTGTPVFFTVDAGPQVKAVCLPEAATAVSAALARVPGVTRVIGSRLGAGARVVPANG